ncbi:hypothetical protein VaNZ11_010147, partial [Volvox africanus]
MGSHGDMATSCQEAVVSFAIPQGNTYEGTYNLASVGGTTAIVPTHSMTKRRRADWTSSAVDRTSTTTSSYENGQCYMDSTFGLSQQLSEVQQPALQIRTKSCVRRILDIRADPRCPGPGTTNSSIIIGRKRLQSHLQCSQDEDPYCREKCDTTWDASSCQAAAATPSCMCCYCRYNALTAGTGRSGSSGGFSSSSLGFWPWQQQQQLQPNRQRSYPGWSPPTAWPSPSAAVKGFQATGPTWALSPILTSSDGAPNALGAGDGAASPPAGNHETRLLRLNGMLQRYQAPQDDQHHHLLHLSPPQLLPQPPPPPPQPSSSSPTPSSHYLTSQSVPIESVIGGDTAPPGNGAMPTGSNGSATAAVVPVPHPTEATIRHYGTLPQMQHQNDLGTTYDRSGNPTYVPGEVSERGRRTNSAAELYDQVGTWWWHQPSSGQPHSMFSQVTAPRILPHYGWPVMSPPLDMPPSTATVTAMATAASTAMVSPFQREETGMMAAPGSGALRGADLWSGRTAGQITEQTSSLELPVAPPTFPAAASSPWWPPGWIPSQRPRGWGMWGGRSLHLQPPLPQGPYTMLPPPHGQQPPQPPLLPPQQEQQQQLEHQQENR